jgi:RHS repeat-associated protein
MSSEQNLQPYKYSGKEQETMMGLTQYDFHARTLDYTYARFTTPDPLAEKYYSISPYAYCGNNPINFIDPDGMDWWENSETGEVYWVKNSSQKNADFTNRTLFGGMLGKGEGQWKWLGEDNMFGDTPENVISSYYDYNILGLTVFSLDYESQNFMKSKGYDFMPTQVLEYSTRTEIREVTPGGMISYSDGFSFVFETEKSSYLPQEYTEKSRTSINSLQKNNDMGYSSVSRLQINYEKPTNSVLKNIGSFISRIFGGAHSNNTNAIIKTDNQLIRDFKQKFPKK